MQHKKSINAKDLLSCKENKNQKNSNNYSNFKCTMVSKQCHQHSQNFQIQKQSKSKIQQSFLFSIRVSRSKNRYKLENSHEQLQKSIKSVDIPTDSAMKNQVQGKKNLDQSHKQCRATNFSPFDNFKGEAPKQDIVQNSSSQIFNNPQINNKIRIKVIKQRIKSKSIDFKSRSQKSRTSTNKIYAKMMEFKTEFSKTKILDNDSLGISTSQQKLSPYQLSIRRKNIRLLKVKLNSLGQRVDENEKQKLIQFSKFCEQDNKSRKLAHKQIPKQFKQKGKKSMFQSLQISKRKQEKWDILNLQSKTIQIRKIPKTARNSVERKRFATNYAENKQKQDN